MGDRERPENYRSTRNHEYLQEVLDIRTKAASTKHNWDQESHRLLLDLKPESAFLSLIFAQFFREHCQKEIFLRVVKSGQIFLKKIKI